MKPYSDEKVDEKLAANIRQRADDLVSAIERAAETGLLIDIGIKNYGSSFVGNIVNRQFSWAHSIRIWRTSEF